MPTREPLAAEIFAEAVLRSDPAQRRAYLDHACSGNAALRAEVESLLRAHEQAGDLHRHLSSEPIPASPTALSRFVRGHKTALAVTSAVVPLETGDILRSLKTGLIDAAAVPPIFALVGQLDTSARHILNLNWSLRIGACVVRKSAWDSIPDDTRELLVPSAAKTGVDIQAYSRREADEAVATMQRRGLTVHEVTPEHEAQFRAAAAELYPDMRGRLVPEEVVDEIQRQLSTLRRN